MICEQNDNLDFLLNIAAANLAKTMAEEIDAMDVSDVVLDEYYYKRRNAIIRREKRKPFWNIVRKTLSKAAMILLVAMAAGFVTIMSVSSLRNAVWDIIITWYEDYIEVHYEVPTTNAPDTQETPTAPDDEKDPPKPLDESNETSQTETTSQPDPTPDPQPNGITKIETHYKPSFIPEGYEEEIVLQSKMRVLIDYYLGDDFAYEYSQMLLTDANFLVNNENTVLQKITISGNEAAIFQIKDMAEIQMLWSDGTYLFSLYAHNNFDLNVLIQVPESIQPMPS